MVALALGQYAALFENLYRTSYSAPGEQYTGLAENPGIECTFFGGVHETSK